MRKLLTFIVGTLWVILLVAIGCTIALRAHAELRNPVIFVGQNVLGGTPSTQLYVDANGQVASGSAPIVNSTNGNTTGGTCTTTKTTLTGMTATTPPAGTYLAFFSGDFSSATSGIVVTIVIAIGGTDQAVTQRKFMPFAGGTLTAGSQRMPASINSIIVLNGSQNVTVPCSTSSGSVTTASMELDLLRIN